MSDLPDRKLPNVYIILLNWNGWQDTIECLESIFHLRYPSFKVIVCDNDSSNDSISRIRDWTQGLLNVLPSNDMLARLLLPSVPKPIPFTFIGGSEPAAISPSSNVQLTLIQTGANLGFAGGVNVGIRHALACEDCDYVWLLNNDTVIEADSLAALVEMAESDEQLGICGSLLRDYAPPNKLQTMGGRKYTVWSGRTRPILEPDTPLTSNVDRALDYVDGASMLIRQRFLRVVGLLNETLFLYFEELDLAARAGPTFHLGFCPLSVVYHKEGASTGSSGIRSGRSALSEFYQARNRLWFTRKYHTRFLISVFVATALGALHRILIGKPKSARAIVAGAISSFRTTMNGSYYKG